MDHSGNCFESCSDGCFPSVSLARHKNLRLPGWEGRGGGGSSELIAKLLSVSNTKSFMPFSVSPHPPAERDTKGKILCFFQGIGRLILLLGFLYFFVCSLDILSSAFQLVGGKNERLRGLGVRGIILKCGSESKTQQALSSCSLLECFRTGTDLRSFMKCMLSVIEEKTEAYTKGYDLAQVA